jgi:hypothetical protein
MPIDRRRSSHCSARRRPLVRSGTPERPFEFGHALEIHPVNGGDQRRRQQHHGSDREAFDNLILLKIDHPKRCVQEEAGLVRQIGRVIAESGDVLCHVLHPHGRILVRALRAGKRAWLRKGREQSAKSLTDSRVVQKTRSRGYSTAAWVRAHRSSSARRRAVLRRRLALKGTARLVR